MNKRIADLRNYIFTHRHYRFRRSVEELGLADMGVQMEEDGLCMQLRAARRLALMLAAENPVILPHEKIVATRTIRELPSIYTEEEWKEIASTRYLHEKGDVCNVSADYAQMLADGLGKKRNAIEKKNARRFLEP